MYLNTLKIFYCISKLNFVAHGVKFDALDLFALMHEPPQRATTSITNLLHSICARAKKATQAGVLEKISKTC